MRPSVLVVEVPSAAGTPSFRSDRLPAGLSRALAGGKGRSLAELSRAGFRTPRTLVFTTELFRAHVRARGAESLFGALARDLAQGRRPPARGVARARRVLATAPLAPDLRARVREALARLLELSPSGKLAVRSSAVGEDHAKATFAGLHDTFLALETVDAAEDALRRCWLSLLSDRALEYRARLRLRSPLAMAVVAQEHVVARVAGVAFSCVGHGEGTRVVVELAPPGESAPVTGAETPERFEVKRVPTGGASKGDVRIAAAPLERWLTADQAIDVVRQALRAEEYLEQPADIEWLLASRASGPEVVVVQARPAQAKLPPRYDRTALAESLPDALAPLPRDFVAGAYARAFARFHTNTPPEIAARILVYAGGRLWIDTWRLGTATAIGLAARGRETRDARWRASALATARASEKRLEALARSVPAASEPPVAGLAASGSPGASPRDPARSSVASGSQGATGPRDPARGAVASGSGASAGSGGSRRVASRAQLARLLSAAERELDRLLPLYLLAQEDVGLVQEAIARTRARLEYPLGAPPALEAGAIDLARALSRAARPLLAGKHDHPAVRELVEGFGHRGGVELDLASPPLGEDQEALRALAGASRAGSWKRPELPVEFRHPALRGLLEHGRAAAARADRLRDVVTRAVRVARRVVLAAGELLHGAHGQAPVARTPKASRGLARKAPGARGTLASRDDVFFLELAELRALLAGKTVARLRARIARRRRVLDGERARHVPLRAHDPRRDAVAPAEAGGALHGIAASSGVARGPARVVRRPEDLSGLDAREVLVAHAATADLFGALVGCAGLVTEVGGMLSHGAILARELAVPAVVATGDASSRIRTGDEVVVDGDRGVVFVTPAARG